jgi:hypothetical protein
MPATEQYPTLSELTRQALDMHQDSERHTGVRVNSRVRLEVGQRVGGPRDELLSAVHRFRTGFFRGLSIAMLQRFRDGVLINQTGNPIESSLAAYLEGRVDQAREDNALVDRSLRPLSEGIAYMSQERL